MPDQTPSLGIGAHVAEVRQRRSACRLVPSTPCRSPRPATVRHAVVAAHQRHGSPPGQPPRLGLARRGLGTQSSHQRPQGNRLIMASSHTVVGVARRLRRLRPSPASRKSADRTFAATAIGLAVFLETWAAGRYGQRRCAELDPDCLSSLAESRYRLRPGSPRHNSKRPVMSSNASLWRPAGAGGTASGGGQHHGSKALTEDTGARHPQSATLAERLSTSTLEPIVQQLISLITVMSSGVR
jgi:hypothetical protein